MIDVAVDYDDAHCACGWAGHADLYITNSDGTTGTWKCPECLDRHDEEWDNQ